jgi:hypothetical protein
MVRSAPVIGGIFIPNVMTLALTLLPPLQAMPPNLDMHRYLYRADELKLVKAGNE